MVRGLKRIESDVFDDIRGLRSSLTWVRIHADTGMVIYGINDISAICRH